MLGGELRRKNMAFYGGLTVDALDALHVDRLFLAWTDSDLERGITTHYEPEAMLNRKMVEAARMVAAITDDSKFGWVCLHRILPISGLDTLITDTGAPEDIRQASEELGFESVAGLRSVVWRGAPSRPNARRIVVVELVDHRARQVEAGHVRAGRRHAGSGGREVAPVRGPERMRIAPERGRIGAGSWVRSPP